MTEQSWPSPAAADEAVRIVAELTGRFHNLADQYPAGDPRREAFFAAQLAAEETGRQVRRALARPVESPAVSVPREVGERSRWRIARHKANGGYW